MPRRAFTLLELMAVIVLMGLLSTATAWLLVEDSRRSSRGGMLATLVHADAMARMAAVGRGATSTLWIDLDHRKLWRQAGGEESPAAELPGNCRLQRVLMRGGDAAHDATGLAGVEIGPDGRSESYAVQVAFADGPRQGSDRDGLNNGDVWIVFCGLTGQAAICGSEDEVYRALDIGKNRPDAP
jgi:prepilin-type N-terminal cleavage/methylation domain-containing protein